MANAHTTFQQPEGLLAHYTTAVTAFERILHNVEHVDLSRKLRMSPYSAMRDPAENKDLPPA